jgi:L-arabinose isomerase
MSIEALKELHLPLAVLYTGVDADIPYKQADMNYMNFKQVSHAADELCDALAFLGVPYETIVGYYQHVEFLGDVQRFSQTAAAYNDFRHLKVAMVGGKMPNVFCTSYDSAKFHVDLGPITLPVQSQDVADYINKVPQDRIQAALPGLIEGLILDKELELGGARRSVLESEIAYYLGIQDFLRANGCGAFTDYFGALHGFERLPGFSVQQLMSEGIGFAAEGHVPNAAFLRLFLQMDLDATFMEDYLPSFERGIIFGAHMLEVKQFKKNGGQGYLKIAPLSIGEKADPVRLVSISEEEGPMVKVGFVNGRKGYYLIAMKVQGVKAPAAMPNLPVSGVFWKPLPDMKIGIQCWTALGGPHHTILIRGENALEQVLSVADMIQLKVFVIDENSTVRSIRDRLVEIR